MMKLGDRFKLMTTQLIETECTVCSLSNIAVIEFTSDEMTQFVSFSTPIPHWENWISGQFCNIYRDKRQHTSVCYG